MPLSFSSLSGSEPWVQALAGVAVLCLFALATRALALLIFKPVLRRVRQTTNTWLTEVGLHDKVLAAGARILPSMVIVAGVRHVPQLNAEWAAVLGNVAQAFMTVQVVRALVALLDAALEVQQARPQVALAMQARTRSIKSYVQLGKLVVILAGAVVAVASLLDRSPAIVLSGLGAMSAVLMLVFKDTILSFTAGVLLSSNDMLRLGDWIEMPQVGADGAVIDIALHTVKVQNWDKTITTIPTWRLMSESYRNWRGMSESGGRRIKRTLRIDTTTVGFLDDAQIRHFEKIALLAPYMKAKADAVEKENAERRARLGDKVALVPNQRRLTNLGTFRAYVEAYLRAHPGIHRDMTLMVRQMEPTPEGAPLELYCFTASVAWVEYEATQSDIFEHLIGVLPEFGLRLYQHPSGNDLREGLSATTRSKALAAWA